MQAALKVFSCLALVLALYLVPAQKPALAQSSGEKAKIIEDLMVVVKEDNMLERAFEASVRSLPAEQQDLARETFSGIDQDAVYEQLAASADEIYTTEELKAFYEFRSSDAGRSMMRKVFQMNGKLYEILMKELLKGASSN